MLQQLDLTILNKFLKRVSIPFNSLNLNDDHYFIGNDNGFLSFYFQNDHITEIIADSDLAFEDHQKLPRNNPYQILNEFPVEICDLPYLRTLHIINHVILTVPEAISQCSHLTKLILGAIHITRLPESIGSLSHLEYLDISENPLEKLPVSLNRLTALKTLFMDALNPRLNYSGLHGFVNLENLYFNESLIQKLPEFVWNCPNLNTLWCQNNELTHLSPKIAHLAKLEKLNLSNNQLRSFPPELTQLSNLRSLDLSINPIEEFPTDMPKLQNIENLVLNFCNLSAIPKWIKDLPNLRKLNVEGNAIKNLPDWLFSMPNLEIVEVDLPLLPVVTPHFITDLSEIFAYMDQYNW